MAGEDERHNLFSYLETRFGIREALFDRHILFAGKKSWFLMRNSPAIKTAAQLKVEKIGLRAFRQVGRFIKPTTKFVQIFGGFADRGKVEIDTLQLEILLKGGEIPVDLGIDKGYVILSTKTGHVLGLGFLADGKIRSQLPAKEVRMAMLYPEKTVAAAEGNQTLEDGKC